MECLRSIWACLPALEGKGQINDSPVRMGISLFPVVGTVMYVFNMHRAVSKYQGNMRALSDGQSSADVKGAGALLFRKRIQKYAFWHLCSLAVTAATVYAVKGVALSIFASPPVLAVGCVLVIFNSICLLQSKSVRELCGVKIAKPGEL